LTEELEGLKKAAGAIFIGTSSGTTAQALASYFLKKTAKNKNGVVRKFTSSKPLHAIPYLPLSALMKVPMRSPTPTPS